MHDPSLLNPPQRDAVLHDRGPLVVFAGAGSGKTRVITHRIAHLIEERGVRPYRILAVTFTNKAAGEMRERLHSQIGPAAAELWVGTFHATCAKLLRRYADLVGIRKDFTIYDDQDQQAMIKRILRDEGIDEKRFTPKVVAGRINRAKQEVLSSEELEGDDPLSRIARRVYGIYEERMQAAGALDFGDLIYRLVLALEKSPRLLQEIGGRFEYVLVDEFQDTNHAQLRLVRTLAEAHRNLCVVGDDDQSIYRWRGADRRNILDFRKAFPDARLVKLEQNYRSTQRILRVAHAVIRHNEDREPKELWTENPEGHPILVARARDEGDEARMVVRAAQELAATGLSLADIAVFYRIHAQSRVIEEALRAANVPYRIVGGTRFYDRAEVKDVIAYLRVIHNPDDDVSLLRIINTPARGIGKTSVGRLLDLAAERGIGAYAALAEASSDRRFGSAAKKRLAAFRELLDGLCDDARAGASVAALSQAVIERTGYAEVLRAEDSAEADARLQNLAELLGSIEQLVDERPEADLSTFLEEVTLDTRGEDEEQTDRVTLMTVHAAKGLEFPVVLVTGMEEQMFPFRGLEPWDDPDELEEERRLAYVAFTRARERLVLTHAATRRIFGQLKVGIPSRFIDELPEEDLQRVGEPTSQPAIRGGSARRPSAWEDDHIDLPPARLPPRPRAAGLGESYVDTSEGCDLGDEGAMVQGMRVRHSRFGLGRVVRVGGGIPPRVKVRFDQHGEKDIVARFLEPA